jgi:maltose-binding protein MalE
MQRAQIFCLCACILGISQIASGRETIIIWHTLDVLPAEVLQHHLDQFSKGKDVHFRLETGMDIVESMLESDLLKNIPDAIIGPSDFIGQAESIGLLPVEKLDEKVYAEGVTALVKMDGKIWGYPLVWGNHLMLMHEMKTPPLLDLQDLEKTVATPLGLHEGEPYIFLMFLLGQFGENVKTFSGKDLTHSGIVKALNSYRSLLLTNAVPKDCDYQCVTRDFYQGKLKQTVNGDWALAEIEIHMGANLRLAPLPKYKELQLRSPCASTA